MHEYFLKAPEGLVKMAEMWDFHNLNVGKMITHIFFFT